MQLSVEHVDMSFNYDIVRIWHTNWFWKLTVRKFKVIDKTILKDTYIWNLPGEMLTFDKWRFTQKISQIMTNSFKLYFAY